MSFFSLTISENRRAEQILLGGGGMRGRRRWGKLCRRVNMVQILYNHVYKWKNDIC
jgi:hypothetical protein